jgi:hypothetical protein
MISCAAFDYSWFVVPPSTCQRFCLSDFHFHLKPQQRLRVIEPTRSDSGVLTTSSFFDRSNHALHSRVNVKAVLPQSDDKKHLYFEPALFVSGLLRLVINPATCFLRSRSGLAQQRIQFISASFTTRLPQIKSRQPTWEWSLIGEIVRTPCLPNLAVAFELSNRLQYGSTTFNSIIVSQSLSHRYQPCTQRFMSSKDGWDVIFSKRLNVRYSWRVLAQTPV